MALCWYARYERTPRTSATPASVPTDRRRRAAETSAATRSARADRVLIRRAISRRVADEGWRGEVTPPRASDPRNQPRSGIRPTAGTSYRTMTCPAAVDRGCAPARTEGRQHITGAVLRL